MTVISVVIIGLVLPKHFLSVAVDRFDPGPRVAKKGGLPGALKKTHYWHVKAHQQQQLWQKKKRHQKISESGKKSFNLISCQIAVAATATRPISQRLG